MVCVEFRFGESNKEIVSGGIVTRRGEQVRKSKVRLELVKTNDD